MKLKLPAVLRRMTRDLALPEALPPTVYVRWGDGPAGLLLILLLAGAIVQGHRNRVDPASAGA